MLRRYFDPLTALLAAALLVTAYRLGWIAVNSWHGLRNDDLTTIWWIALSAGLAVLRWAVKAGDLADRGAGMSRPRVGEEPGELCNRVVNIDEDGMPVQRCPGVMQAYKAAIDCPECRQAGQWDETVNTDYHDSLPGIDPIELELLLQEINDGRNTYRLEKTFRCGAVTTEGQLSCPACGRSRHGPGVDGTRGGRCFCLPGDTG